MVIRIDHIQLRLPAAFQPQARALADHFAQALSRLPPCGPARIERLQVAPVTLDPRLGPAAAASAIAAHVQRALQGGRYG